VEEDKPTKTRGLYSTVVSKKKVVQDQTLIEILDTLFYKHIEDKYPKDTVIFDPCSETDAIIIYLHEKGYTKAFGKDKYTTYKYYDCIRHPLPPCDVVIANFPTWQNEDGIELLVDVNKEFMCWLPISMMTSRRNGAKILTNVYKLIIPCPTPTFLHNGEKMVDGSCGWFIGKRHQGDLKYGFQTIIVPDGRMGWSSDEEEDNDDDEAESDD
jgi:hypothetical protein